MQTRYILLWIVVLSVLTTFVTLLLLNEPAFVFPQQMEVAKFIKEVKNTAGKTDSDYRFVQDNFIFIDNSASHQLVPLPGGNQLNDLSTLVITNRGELTQVLQLLKDADTLVDMIVCDLYFDVATPQDSLLRDILTESAIEKKLVLAYSSHHKNTPDFSSLNDSVFGDVEEATNHDILTTHQIVQNHYSLPYKMYCKYNGINSHVVWSNHLLTENSATGTRYGAIHFLPELDVTDEARLYQDIKDKEGEAINSSANFYNQGDLLSSLIRRQFFMQTLQQRKAGHRKNIVMIADFKGNGVDIHNTTFEKMHGATILLNLFLSLNRKQHIISLASILFLLAGFTLIFIILLEKALKRRLVFISPRDRLSKRRQKRRNYSLPKKKRSYFTALVIWLINFFFIEELQYWLLAIIVFLNNIFFDKLINGLSILFLLIVIKKIIESVRKSGESEMIKAQPDIHHN